MDEETTRLFIHGLLEAAFPDVEEIYFRPPGDMLLKRPCVVYTPLQVEPSYANSLTYSVGTRFQVTVLSDLPGLVNARRLLGVDGITVVSNTSYSQNDVVHDVFTITVNSI